MSVYGGDSWAREAQQRKRRVDDLLRPDASSSSSLYKKLASGKYACLVCSNNPVLDSPLMLSMHTKGSRHIAAETRLQQRELSRQEELNKRIALSSDCASVSSSKTATNKAKDLDAQKQPLIEQTRKIILEAQNSIPDKFSAVSNFTNTKPNDTTTRLCGSSFPTAYNDRFEFTQNRTYGECDTSGKIRAMEKEAASKVLADWNADIQKRREKELKFTASGWKRDGHGKWYKDENVEFDSDDEDPNDSFK